MLRPAASRTRRVIVAALVLGLMGACGPSSGWEGRYAGRDTRQAGGVPVLHLQGEGKGRWEVDGESTPLRWEERQGALWLHLQAGGVIAARPGGRAGTLELSLPGVGPLRLTRGD
jgi:hypothetical protein